MLRIAVLISGAGSTLANLIERIADGRLTGVRIVLVVSSRGNVRGVQIARDAGLPLEIIRRKDLDDDAAFGEAVFAAVRRARADVVVMGGFLCYLAIADDFRRRVINIHPALLPKFGGRGMYGLRVQEAVIAAGEKESGCTVHVADEQYDQGPIVAQRRLEVRADDTAESLAHRVGALERELYAAVIQQIADHGPSWLDRPEHWPACRASPSV